MRALVSERPSGPEGLVLGELPEPIVAADSVLIEVKAVGLNFPDCLIIQDRYQFKPERPFAPGGEFSGVVLQVGPSVKKFAPGQRVFGLCGWNGTADRLAVPEERCFSAPDDMTFEQAAAFLMTFATAHYALAGRAQTIAGETLLVPGAGGGVGLAAVELGKLAGLRVIAGVSTPEKAKAAENAGADAVVIYPRSVDDRDVAKSLTQSLRSACGGEGADVVFDPVGGAYCEPVMRAMAWGGRYLSIGFAAGIPQVPMNIALLKSLQILGVFWGEFSRRAPERNAALVEELLAFWRAGSLRPVISRTFDLAQGGEAIRLLEDRKAIGKVVVTL